MTYGDPFSDTEFEPRERVCDKCGEHFTAYHSFEKWCSDCARKDILDEDQDS